MGYSSKRGRRPVEYASRSSHSYVINDPSVKAFLDVCRLPADVDQVDLSAHQVIEASTLEGNQIKHVIAVDGGYTEVAVRKEFPSSTLTFFQFGALIFSVEDLDAISEKPFIDPEDIAKLKNIQRIKLTLPTKNMSFKDEKSLVNSVRRTIFDFFLREPDENSFMCTLKWFLFEEYSNGINTWNLASCPECSQPNIQLDIKDMAADYTFRCVSCNGPIYLTDVFRLHEAVDNELGAGGVLGYISTLIEQVILVHLVRVILMKRPDLLREILFIKDGPLAFFGQTANMHRPMRNLVNYLFSEHALFLAGLEKSGPFVEHADEISGRLGPNRALLLDNNYIYKYILAGKADPSSPYGRTTYYGNKLIFKTTEEQIYVITLPTKDVLLFPKREDFINVDVILFNIRKLRCDMYDCSLIPVTLANKLVSLANHPSSILLEKFAKKGLK